MDKTAYPIQIIDVATGIGTQSTITVYAAGTVNLSTIYSDTAGTVKINPFTTDAFGRDSFYADEGEYDIKVSGVGITTYTLQDVSIYAPTPNVVISEPTSGEWRIKKLRLHTDEKSIIPTYPSAAE